MEPDVKDIIIQNQANQIGTLAFESTKAQAELVVARRELEALRAEKAKEKPEG